MILRVNEPVEYKLELIQEDGDIYLQITHLNTEEVEDCIIFREDGTVHIYEDYLNDLGLTID